MDEAVASENPLPRVHGHWIDNPLLYKSPEDFLQKILKGFVRQGGGLHLLQEFGLSPPNNYQAGSPLGLEQEILILYATGGFGNTPYSMLTEQEFFNAAKVIWGLNDKRIKAIQEMEMPLIIKKCEELQRKKHLEAQENKLKKLQFLTQTWNEKRIDEIFKLMPEEISEDLQQQLSLSWAKTLEQINLRIKSIGTLEDQNNLNLLSSVYDDFVRQISILMYLTPNEIDNITGNEMTRGYLFLDSLAEFRSALKSSWDIASIGELVKKNRALILRDDEAAIAGQREQIFDKLMYGAENNASSQSMADQLFRQPVGSNRQTPLE